MKKYYQGTSYHQLTINKNYTFLYFCREIDFEEELSGEISVVGVVPSEPESGVEISACDDKEEPSSDTR